MADEQNAPKTAPASPPATSPQAVPSSAPVKSTSSPLKVLIPIVALVAVVFGVTFVSQYTPRQEDPATAQRAVSDLGKHPLRFGTSIRRWDPQSESPLDLYFPGFYEPSDALRTVSFWFENRNPSPVSIQSEGQGTPGYRLAEVPGPVTDELVLTSILSGFPQGAVSGLPVAFAASTANLDASRLPWQSSSIADNRPKGEFKVVAADPSRFFAYRWGIVELSYQVKEIGRPNQANIPAALFVQKVEATGATGNDIVQVISEGMDAFDLYPRLMEIGEMSETSDPKTFTVIAYSCTRGPNLFGIGGNGEFAAPKVVSEDPFVTVGEPVKIPAGELFRLSGEITSTFKNPKGEGVEKMVRVDSAYRYTVTVKPRAGDRLPDIGNLHRAITFELQGAVKKQLHIAGSIRGPMWLENNRKDIVLPSYQAKNGIIQSVRIVADHPDAEVRLVPAECSPPFVRYEIVKVPSGSDRGLYDLKVTVPENQKGGAWSGTIVLEMTGPRAQRIRIPVHGTASR